MADSLQSSSRLGQAPSNNVDSLRDSIDHLLISPETSTFPFQRLPDELQELVLSHTDIIAPVYLSWNEPRRNYRSSTCMGDNAVQRPRLPWHSRSTYLREFLASQAQYDAYISSIDAPWSLPAAIFMVNKKWNEMAMKLFLSQNRFIIWNTNHTFFSAEEWLTEPIQILQQIPKDWSSDIRWLRFSWDNQLGLANLDGDNPGWNTLSTLLKAWPTVELLTVEVDFYCFLPWDVYVEQGQVDTALEMFRTVAGYFQLDGKRRYKDFFFWFTYNVESLEEDWARWSLEKELERQVMGMEDYDAAQRGKYHNQKLRYDESLRPKVFWSLNEGVQWNDERLWQP